MPRPSGAEARQAAHHILERPEFQPEPKSLYDRAVDWVGHLLGRLIEAVVGGGRGALVAWLLLVALVGLSAWLIARGIRSGRRLPGRDDGTTVVEPRRSAADWEAEAIAREAEGDWRAALRCRYRALVARLARAGVVDEVPGRTAGEYRLLVRRGLPPAADAFAQASDRFERAWYGGAVTTQADSAAVAELAERVASMAPSP